MNIEEMVERLRRTERCHVVTMLGHTYPHVPVNPDGPAAADMLERLKPLEEEVVRLRAEVLRLRNIMNQDGLVDEELASQKPVNAFTTVALSQQEGEI